MGLQLALEIFLIYQTEKILLLLGKSLILWLYDILIRYLYRK